MDSPKQAPAGRLPQSQVENLTGLVDYASGAVVSRTLVDGDAGTLTLFAFDTGQHLSEHTAPYDAVVQILEGKAGLVIDGRELSADSGDVVLMPAGLPHAVTAVGPFKMLLTMFRT